VIGPRQNTIRVHRHDVGQREPVNIRAAILAGCLAPFVAIGVTACSEGQRATLVPDETLAEATSTTSTTTTTIVTTTIVTTTTIPTILDGVTAPNGRQYPGIPTDAVDIAKRLVEIEWLVRGTPFNDPVFGDYAHEQQILYRYLGRHPEIHPTLWETVPASLSPAIELQLAGRASIAGIPGGDPPVNVPAWEIIEPLPADELLALYQQAGADTGIDWTFLAAINLLETGFGRIDGLSTAGAQGPMQFLPTTWEEVSNGDITDPYDAIPAAARYLVRRGGPEDMQRALWGYNNSDHYVAAVSAYAELFGFDIATFHAAHAWEIHYSAAIGDLWLPVGYRLEEATPAVDYLGDAPWSAPPPPPAQ
jgi:hypothetical protein